jgi:sugar phosphate isomerase/epimerase
MYTSRRNFIKNTGLLAAGAAFMPNDLFASPKKIERLGLQLYTVRDAMKADPAGTLKKISDMGYEHVEHANYVDRKFYGYPVKDFKKLLNDVILQMPSGHTVMSQKHWDKSTNDFTDAWKYTIEDAAEIGQRYVISPGLDDSLKTDESAFKAFMEVFNKCGELCQKHDLRFGYHNHDFEFTSMFGDKRLYDVMLENTDPKLVTQQMDIGNMFITGAQPLDYLKKYPDRFELMHVKDVFKPAGSEKFENTLLGKGVIPLKEILKTARKIGGTSQFIIEQEEYQGMDPLACSKLDLKVMNGWGY